MLRSILDRRHCDGMSTLDSNQILGSLEADGAWLHGLARSLCRDPERARDAAQATLVTAIEKPPKDGPGRPWLARVLRNRLSEDWRTDMRRTDREHQRAIDTKPKPPAHQALARLELQETVATAVRALEEPYRTAIVLRFLDGQPPRRIAAQLGVPIKTVKSRLERGLAKLRSRLDKEYGGDRGVWTSALLALPLPSLTTGILTGVNAMGFAAKVGASAGVIAAVIVGSLYWNESRTAEVERSIEAHQPALLPELSEEVPVEDLAAVDYSGREQQGSPQEDPIAVEPSWTYVGLVVDTQGLPLSGVDVGLRREATKDVGWIGSPVKSGQDGSVVFVLDEEQDDEVYNRLVFDSVDPSWVAVRREVAQHRLEARDDPGAAAPRRLVVARARRVEGQVLDESGMPLANVQLCVELPLGLRRSLESGTDAATTPTWEQESDSQGNFTFGALPALTAFPLLSKLGGFSPREDELPDADITDLSIVLTRLSAGQDVAWGRVLGPDGLPYAGALVSAGGESMHSEDSGWFAVPIVPENDWRSSWGKPSVRAVAKGLLPAEVELDTSLEVQPFLELHLKGASLAISGSVHGIPTLAEGERRSRSIYVWANGIAPFGMATVSRPGGVGYQKFTFLEEQLAETRSILGAASSLVDQAGQFRIDGLRDKSYSLFVFDSATLALSGPFEVQAGSTAIELLLRDDSVPLEIRGRVLDRQGNPVEGVSVSASRELEVDSYTHPGGPSARTDDNGRFSLGELSFDSLQLYVRDNRRDSDLAERGFSFERGDVGVELQLVVGRRCRLRFTTNDSLLKEASFWIENEDGEQLSLEQVDGNTSRLSGQFSLAEGNSGIIHVEDAAREFVIEVESGDLLRIPIELKPGILNEVQVN